MKPLSDAIRRFAEEPDSELPEPPLPTRRITRPDFTLVLSPAPTHSAVSRVRTTVDGLDATIDEVRSLLRAAGYTGCGWYLGPSCRPDGIVARLVERGFVPAVRSPYEPVFTAMALATPPPASTRPKDVEARPVRDFEEYERALALGMEVFSSSAEDTARWLAAAPLLWSHASGIAQRTQVAYVDGRLAGFGFAAPGPAAVLLGGGAVLPQYRGRGVYRALVASRWEAAVEMGKPALTVHAGAMSRPILERCGFEEVCRVEVLADTKIGV